MLKYCGHKLAKFSMLSDAAKNVLWRAQRIRAGFGPHGLILIYHRIAEPQADPWNMAVSPARFEAQMAVLKQYAVPRTMSGLAQHISTSGGSDRSVAVTFDDGYVDNLTHALPILQRHQIPATVFVISSAIGQPNAFWWDLLKRVFLESPQLPKNLTLSSGEQRHTFDLGSSATLDASDLAQNASWRADLTSAQTGRQQAFLDVWAHMLELSPKGQAQAAHEVTTWAGLSDAKLRPSDGRPMDCDELLQLSGSPLIEIGGHTHTHADLSRLTPEQTSQELVQGRQILKELTNQPISSFAYPYGRYAGHTSDQIKQTGFACAGWSRPGLVVPSSDTLTLPRQQIVDMDGASFETLMASVFGCPLGFSGSA